jgi:hypothetical protein
LQNLGYSRSLRHRPHAPATKMKMSSTAQQRPRQPVSPENRSITFLYRRTCSSERSSMFDKRSRHRRRGSCVRWSRSAGKSSGRQAAARRLLLFKARNHMPQTLLRVIRLDRLVECGPIHRLDALVKFAFGQPMGRTRYTVGLRPQLLDGFDRRGAPSIITSQGERSRRCTKSHSRSSQSLVSFALAERMAPIRVLPLVSGDREGRAAGRGVHLRSSMV